MTPADPASSQELEMQARPAFAGVLQDGEVILLALKPSSWFVLLTSLPLLLAAAGVALAAWAVSTARPQAPAMTAVMSVAAAAGLLRLVLAAWAWLGRTYLLTNRRTLILRGLLRMQILSVMLAEVEQATVTASAGERMLGIGTLRFDIPAAQAGLAWQSIARPFEVLRVVQEALDAARRTYKNNGATPPPSAPHEGITG